MNEREEADYKDILDILDVIGNNSNGDSSRSLSKKTTVENRLNALRPVYGYGYNSYRTGLKNLGSTCYLNSVVQSLVHTEPIINKLVEIGKLTNCKLEGLCGELAFISKIMNSGEYRHVSPIKLREELAKVDQCFGESEQQDAHETLVWMLDRMEKEMKTLDENERLIENTFDGKVTARRECTKCKEKYDATDVFRYLQIEIPESQKKVKTLEMCIDDHMKTEKVDDKRCTADGCKNSTNAIRTKTLTKIPEVLIINLKRFRTSENKKKGSRVRWQATKVYSHVKAPIHLDMRKYTKESNCEYQLYSVINHKGGTASGHYTTVCYEAANKEWVCYDDDKVDNWDENDLEENKQAYIYFYKRKDNFSTEEERKKEVQVIEEGAGDMSEARSEAHSRELGGNQRRGRWGVRC